MTMISPDLPDKYDQGIGVEVAGTNPNDESTLDLVNQLQYYVHTLDNFDIEPHNGILVRNFHFIRESGWSSRLHAGLASRQPWFDFRLG